MPITDAALWTEINSETYNALDDQPCADLLNATTGATAGTLQKDSISKDDFGVFFSTAMGRVEAGATTDAGKALLGKWETIEHDEVPLVDFQTAVPGGTVTLTGILSQLVGDGVMTQGEADAFTTRPASRAEILFGSGTVVTWWDVARVRNANGRA